MNTTELYYTKSNIKIYSIDEIKNLLFNYFESKPVNKAYIFGSYARMEAKKNSDVDILVDLEYIKGIGMIYAFMKTELEDMLQKQVDLITTHSISKYIRNGLEKDKVLIYEKRYIR